MQKAIKMCLAAATLSVSEAVSIKSDWVVDTKCEKEAQKNVAERLAQCGTTFDVERVC